MVQMAPNKSIVSATVLAIEPYTSPGFDLLSLEVTTAKKLADQLQMPGANAGDQLQAIVSQSMIQVLKLTKGSKVQCELKKVSLNLWRVQSVTVKPAATKKKKK
jgi:hypothetical protein